MDIDSLRAFCNSLPNVTEDIKWGNDLCFCIGSKMFCVAGLQLPLSVSFKVTPDEFDELSTRNGIRPAPYVAKYKWILVQDMQAFSKSEWEHYIRQSYSLVYEKLAPKIKKQLTQQTL